MNKKFLSSIVHLFFALALLSACSRNSKEVSPGTNATEKNTTAGRLNVINESIVTTVAHINVLSNGNVQYNFNEKQAVFTVLKTDPSYARILTLAREALAGTKPVKLIYSDNNLLSDLGWPTTEETARYLDWYRLKIVQPEADRVLNITDLSASYFNTVDWQNWKVFKLCIKTIPSFAAAKTIFNYCAAQGCYLGPTQVQPCIPFQYVKDGCFARAHKMRWIIETKYGYCSEKVFSYGNLDVKADKWGGCCVGWWYHVAPLVRVQSGRTVLCYVIDPGMFNEPVLLSTWLSAQGNTTCDASSAVTSYSIQPSSAYTPSYTTDPGYTQTNSDLVYYNGQGNTCN